MIAFEGFEKVFNNPSTLKVIATENRDGFINMDFRHHLYANPIGCIFLFEEAEYSSLNCNLVYSLWFNKNAVISIISNTQQSYEIQVKITRSIVSGREFSEACEWLSEEYERFDLSTIWVLEPLEIRNTSNLTQINNERKIRPMITHLDRLARKESIYEQEEM